MIVFLKSTYGGGKLSLNAQFISYESDQQIRFYIYVNEKPVSGGGYFTCDLKKGGARSGTASKTATDDMARGYAQIR